MQTKAVAMDLSKCGGSCRGDCVYYQIGRECPNDVTYTTPYREIAAPRTWGELKTVIADFPDDAPIVWVNQPLQSIFSRKDGGSTIIGFQ